VSVVAPSIRFSVQDIRNKQSDDTVLNQVIQRLRLGRRREPENPDVKSWIKRKDIFFLDK
jgi:hypothetical protein